MNLILQNEMISNGFLKIFSEDKLLTKVMKILKNLKDYKGKAKCCRSRS